MVIAKRLTERQVGLIKPVVVDRLLKTKNSSSVGAQILLYSPEGEVYKKTSKHFVRLVKQGNQQAFMVLVEAATKSPNPSNRWRAIGELLGLLEVRSKELLPILTQISTKDSDRENRGCALLGLVELATNGHEETFSGLVHALDDPNQANRSFAKSGLQALARKGNLNAQAYLKRRKIQWQ
jgi:hypothetical protein